MGSERSNSSRSVLRHVGLGILGSLILGIIHITPSFLSVPNKAKQTAAREILKSMNQEQQEYFAKNGSFLEQSQKLRTYEAAYSSLKPYYRHSTRIFKNRAYSYAIPIQEYEFGQFLIFPWNRYVGLKSYVGIVVVTDSKTNMTESTVCWLKAPDEIIVPNRQHGALTCS